MPFRTLTFALEFALAAIEQEWLASNKGVTLSKLRETLEQVMADNPKHWQKHYHGNDDALRYARKYSYSDRSRYYWPHPDLASALRQLVENLTANPAPLTLLSQFMPRQYDAVRSGLIRNAPVDLIRNKIMEVTADYSYACGPT